MAWVRTRIVSYKKGRTRLAKFTSCLLRVGASSTTKIGRNDIAEILLKVTLKHQKSTKNIDFLIFNFWTTNHLHL